MRPSLMHDPEIKKIFIELWCAGFPRAHIREVVGLNDDRRVWYWARRLGLQLRGKQYWLGRKRRGVRGKMIYG